MSAVVADTHAVVWYLLNAESLSSNAQQAMDGAIDAGDPLEAEITRLFAAKEARRHKLAALPFPEKVRAVVRLQEMAAPVLRARGENVRVWKLDDRVP